MKIAITADVHLRTKAETPERYLALETLVNSMHDFDVSTLVVAGDLFDKDFHNYADFDAFCKLHSSKHFLAIPGNHDLLLEQKYFTASNLEIVSSPEIKILGSIPFVFLPYDAKLSMDEALSNFFIQRKGEEELKNWVLIGHGDYVSRSREMNPYEKGIYMPLSSGSVSAFRPSKVVLGHIHKPYTSGSVWYAGSPFPLDINETGKRRCLLFDTDDNSLVSVDLPASVIYFVENIVVLPSDNEISYLTQQLEQMIDNWQLLPEDFSKVRLRLSVKGFTTDKAKISGFVNDFLHRKGIGFYDATGIDTTELNILKDEDRISLFEKVKKIIDELPNFDYAGKDDILEQTLRLIFV
jgi:DNA repair exonuclease SbcCD nuclease subunit